MAITPPADRLTCADEPASPGDTATDADAANYIVDLRDAWANCYDAVAWIRDWSTRIGETQ